MSNSLIFLITMIIIPLILFFVEYHLTKKQSRLAIVLPIIVLCFAILVPPVIITSVIMFVIYFATKDIEKEKKERLSEIEKMNIQDL